MTTQLTIDVHDEPTQTFARRRGVVTFAGIAEFYDGAYAAVAEAISAHGGRIAGPAIGWYASMPTDTVDLAAGFPVDGLEPGDLGGDVDVVVLEGGECAVATYLGPYDGLGAAWAQFAGWCDDHQREVRGDFWEVYVTEPSPEGDPNRNVTRLVLPLA